MISPIPEHYTLQLYNATIDFIPVLPYKAPCAIQVFRVLRFPGLQYDAIAVSAGPSLTSDARNWIQSFPGSDDQFPLMSGIARMHNVVRQDDIPSLKECADQYGLEPEMINASVLSRYVHYKNMFLHCLSPVDSYTEVLRSSIELDIPVYGIDLDSYTLESKDELIVQNPPQQSTAYFQWADTTQSQLASQHMSMTNRRRAFTIAARLKSLAIQHKRILCVADIRHLKFVHKYLASANVRPALYPEGFESSKEVILQRVIVHPLIAIAAMDLFPHIVTWYEEQRKHWRLLDETTTFYCPDQLCTQMLNDAYSKEFDTSKVPIPADNSKESAHFESFEQFRANLSMVRAMHFPDYYTILKSASLTMGDSFVQHLTDTILSLPWLTKKEMPDIPSIELDNNHQGELEFTIRKGDTILFRGILGSDCSGKQLSFFRTLPFRVLENDSQEQNNSDVRNTHFTWGPWDCLISALAIEARGKTREASLIEKATPFVHSTGTGLNTRKTINSIAKGNDTLFINEYKKAYAPVNTTISENGFPVVVIFENLIEEKATVQNYAINLDRMQPYFKDRNLYDMMKEAGMLHLKVLDICQASRDPLYSPDRTQDINTAFVYGFLLLQPMCWCTEQFTRWYEYTRAATHFRNNHHTLGSIMKSFFESSRAKDDWAEKLIHEGIRYAQKNLTVVIPEYYTIPEYLYDFAKDRNVTINVSFLSSYNPQLVTLSRNFYATPLEQLEPDYVYPKWAEDVIGHSQSTFRNLVPKTWYNFGLRNPRY